MQIGIPTTLVAALIGGPGLYLRSKDVDKIESRLDKSEQQYQVQGAAIIKLEASAHYQGETLQRIQNGVDLLNTKVDTIRDRLPR